MRNIARGRCPDQGVSDHLSAISKAQSTIPPYPPQSLRRIVTSRLSSSLVEDRATFVINRQILVVPTGGAAGSSLLCKGGTPLGTPLIHWHFLHATAGTAHDPQIRPEEYCQKHGKGQSELYVLRACSRRTDQGYDDDADQQGKGYHAHYYHRFHHKRVEYSSV